MRRNDSSTGEAFTLAAPRPTAKEWARHIALFLAAVFSTTLAGALQPFGYLPIMPDANPERWDEILRFLISFQTHYLQFIFEAIGQIWNTPVYLQHGLSFSLSLLAILAAHEAGHYVACRIYGVDATLPFFIPVPPLLGPAGTLGAFIKIRAPMPSRRATFDIGVAGPIAGFLVIVPVALLGFLTWRQAAFAAPTEGAIVFSDSLFLRFFAFLFGIDLNVPFLPNPFYAAAWLGLLVTSLNLIPSGQLDGGHAIFAVFGRRVHRATGRIAFAVMAAVTILGFYLYNSPSGLLFTILLGVMLRLRHPEPMDATPLDFKRKIIALLVLLIFILCFVPFPIQIK